MSEETLNQFQSHLPHVFGRVLVDEAHALKSMLTLDNRAIHLLKARTLIFLTGTAMINRPIDLHGSLWLVWRDGVHDAENVLPSEESSCRRA